MKFDCGESLEDLVSRLTNWHRHFAVIPRMVASHDCRWMEYVERRVVSFYPDSQYAYRAAP